MDVDLKRWQALVEQLEETKAVRRGLVAELTELQQRQVEAANKLGILESRYEHRYGPLPADAAIGDFPAYAARPGHPLQRGQVDEAKPVLELRAELRNLNRQAERYEQRLAPLRRRFSELDSLYRGCLSWAQRENVHLPGADQGLTTATLQDAGGRSLNLGVGDASGLAGAGPLASSAARPGFLATARGWLGATP